MLTQLVTVKKRLDIALSDATFDEALTRAIEAVSARVDRECNRTLTRTVDITQEFCADEIEIPAICYPIESVSGFELRSSAKAGWVAQASVDYNVRRNCVISLAVPLVPHPPASVPSVARVNLYGWVCCARCGGRGWAKGASGGPGMGGGGGDHRVVSAAGQSRACAGVAERRHLPVFEPTAAAAGGQRHFAAVSEMGGLGEGGEERFGNERGN